MSETPPKPPESGGEPPTPPSSTPPPGTEPPPPSGPPPAGSGDDALMLVLAYLWILALIPLLAEKGKPNVQWHAKNGILILAAEIVVWVALSILQFLPFLGTILGCGLIPLVFLGFLVVRIIAIVKATQGQKFRLPLISDYVDQWK